MLKITTRFVCFICLLSAVFLLLSNKGVAQTTYTWSGVSGGSWAVATNWTPNRVTPATSDIIQFNGGGPMVVTGVVTQTIQRLIVTNNTDVTLQSGAAGIILRLGNVVASNVLTIDGGSVMQIGSTGANVLTIAFPVLANLNTNIAGTLSINANAGLTNTMNFTNLTAANNIITGTIINNGGNITSTAATTTFGNGSTYRHVRNNGIIPAATWTNSAPYPTCQIMSATASPTGINQAFGHLTISTGAAVTSSLSGATSVNGTLTLNTGILSLIANTLTLNGDLVITSGSITGGPNANITIAGTAANLTLPAIANNLRHLIINRASGVTLGAPLTLSTTGILTLTNGILTTSAANLLTVSNTAVGAVAGGSASAYINGPLTRGLPANLVTGTTYIFPVGKTAYNLFELVNPTTGAAAGTVRVETFDADCGGSTGIGLAALNSNRYWQATPSAAFITAATVRLTEPALGAANRVAQCATLNGTYMQRGGTPPSPVLSGPVLPSLNFFALGTNAPVTLNGTYTVGASGTFTKLTDVANALNIANVTGNVIFELLADYDGTVGEAFPIIFYQYGMTGGPWSATVRPTAGVVAMLSTSGTTSSSGLITWSGIDKIKFDGRPGGIGDSSNIRWQIQNTASGGAFPTILFLDGACNNVLQYLNIQATGSSSSETIYLSTSTVAGGNSFDTIRNCNIGPYGAGVSYKVIYSSGTAAPNANASNVIINNKIYNFQGFNGPSFPIDAGVCVSATGNGSNWNISNNSFYATVTTNANTAAGIYFGAGSASTGNTITGNYIGGQSSKCGGAYWDYHGYWNQNVLSFAGIYVAAGTATITNNTISNIQLHYTAGSQVFRGIHVDAATSATLSGNMIGSNVACNSIYGGNVANIIGIFNESPQSPLSDVTIDRNIIANCTSNFDFPNTGYSQNGIVGIYVSNGGYVTGKNTITNNVIFNLKTANNYNASIVNWGINLQGGGCAPYGLISNMALVTGIYLCSNTNTTHTIANNTIYGLNSTVTGGTNKSWIFGIIDNTYTGTTNINANRIYSFYAPDTYGSSGTNFLGICGIYLSDAQLGTHNITNNMIHFGYKADGTSVRNEAIVGIWDNYNFNGTTLKVNTYHNSVFIGGTDNTVLNSVCYERILSGCSSGWNNENRILDNLFVNTRTSTGGGKHYGMYLNTSTNVTCNYNDVYGTGTGFNFGYWNGADYATRAAWNTANTFDANSLTVDPLFQSTGVPPDLHLKAGSPVIANGTSAGVTTDYDGNTRSGSYDMGADQYAASYLVPTLSLIGCGQEIALPVELLTFDAACHQSSITLSWATASETNNDYFTLERSQNAEDWTLVAMVPGAGNSNTLTRYSYRDHLPETGHIYYRLWQTDYDGARAYLGLLASPCDKTEEPSLMRTYPNPFNSEVMVTFSDFEGKAAWIELWDVMGKQHLSVTLTESDIVRGNYLLKTDMLTAGVYLLKFRTDASSEAFYVIKYAAE